MWFQGLFMMLLSFGIGFAGQFRPTVLEQNKPKVAQLTLQPNQHAASLCSKSMQNCIIQVAPRGCLNSAGSVFVRNNSSFPANNIQASSSDSNFLQYIIQNNGCPKSLNAGASCSISFNTNTSISFLVPNVMVKGSNTSTSFFNMNAVQCAYTISGTVSGLLSSGLILQNNSADNLSVVANASNFTFPHSVSWGKSYNVTIYQQPSGLTCSVNNGSGTDLMGNVDNVTITCTPSSAGYLVPLPAYSIATGSYPQQIAISPNGLFAYVANLNSLNVSAYSINTATGELTPISGSPFLAGTNPRCLVVAPNNQFVYVSNQGSNNISAYNANTSTGALTEISGSPYSELSPQELVVSPDKQFLYNTSAYAMITTHSINSSTGAITPTESTYPGPETSIAISADGQLIYAINPNTDQIFAYTVDTTTGALTSVPGSPYATGNNSVKVLISPDKQFVYVANSDDKSISVYAINVSTGALTPIAGSPFSNGSNNPLSMAMSANGLFLYLANGSGNITAYTINTSTGALTAIPGSPFDTDGALLGIAISPDNQFVYGTRAIDNLLVVYRVYNS